MAQDSGLVVHTKQGSRRAVMRWYKRDVQAMAKDGYVEVNHQMEGVARGCAALFVPPRAQMIVTYRKLDRG